MQAGDYFIFPATRTTDDDGRVLDAKPAVLHENGTERKWTFATTAEAKDEAELWFDVKAWERDDLGTLWSRA